MIRAAKRQAAPFAKGPPAGQPKKVGRKPGKDYDTKAYRKPPAPDQIDEVDEAPLPDRCPDCGSPRQPLRAILTGSAGRTGAGPPDNSSADRFGLQPGEVTPWVKNHHPHIHGGMTMVLDSLLVALYRSPHCPLA